MADVMAGKNFKKYPGSAYSAYPIQEIAQKYNIYKHLKGYREIFSE